MTRQRAWIHVAYGVAFLALVWLGRQTNLPENGLAVLWPAAGVSVVWVLRSRARVDMLIALLGIYVLAAAGNKATGAALDVSLVLGLGNAAIGLVARVTWDLAARGRSQRIKEPALRVPNHLVLLGVSCFTAGVLTSVTSPIAALVTGNTPTWAAVVAWIIRISVGSFVVAAPALAMRGSGLFASGPVGAARRTSRLLGLDTTGQRLELVALIAATVLVTLVVFSPGRTLPLAFTPFAALAWGGARFTPVIATSNALLAGGLAVVLTLVDGGPFANVVDPVQQANVVSLYVALAMGVTTTLTLSRQEQASLAQQLVHAEERARGRADMMDAITDTMVDGLAVIDGRGNVLVRNPAAAEMTGGDPDVEADPVGEPSEYGFFLIDGSEIPPEDRPLARALRGQHVEAMDLRHIHPVTGQVRTMAVNAAPLYRRDLDEEPLAVMLFRDVTEERVQVRQLQGFAGVVAHDLQNPLTAVTGWAGILREQLEDLGSDQIGPALASLGRVDGAAGRMGNLIADLLAFAQARTAELRPTEVDLDTLAAEVADDVRHRPGNEKVVIDLNPLGRVCADPILTRQLLANLVGNAVKYVPKGVAPHISISGRPREDMIQVRVVDNGVGVPPAQRQQVFDAFHRAHSDFPGTGLGLAICARAVERHGGTIAVVGNQDGPGSTFAFTLPAANGSSS